MSTTQKGQKLSKLPSSTGDGKKTSKKPKSSLEVPVPERKKTQEFPALLEEWERLAVHVKAKYFKSRAAAHWGPATSYNWAMSNLKAVCERAVPPCIIDGLTYELGVLHIGVLPDFNSIIEDNGPEPGPYDIDDDSRYNDSRVLWWVLDACAQALDRDGRLRGNVALLTALACALLKGAEMVERMSPLKGQPREAYLAAVIVFVKFLHNFLQTIATTTSEADAPLIAGFVDTWAKNCSELYVPAALKLSLQASDPTRSV